jgi:hypothetical protein
MTRTVPKARRRTSRPAAPADPLGKALAAAARTEADPALREWARRLAAAGPNARKGGA